MSEIFPSKIIDLEVIQNILKQLSLSDKLRCGPYRKET